MARLQLHLAGIPADMKPFLRLFEEARETMPYFVPFLERNLDEVRLNKRIRLQKPVARIISQHNSGESSVCGIVVKNPFQDKDHIPKGKLKYSPLEDLHSPEYLICDLKDWHNTDSIVDYYHLMDIAGIRVDHATVFRCSATWNAILNPRYPEPAIGEITKPLPSLNGPIFRPLPKQI